MPLPRRNFLKSAGSPILAAPFFALPGWATESQNPSSPLVQPVGVQPVGAGEDRTGHLHSLGFSSMAFKVLSADTGGNLFIIEHRNLGPGTGPPLHLHYSQDEWFYVMESAVIFQVGKKRVTLRAGESVLAPRRIPHTFSAVGAPAHMLIAFTPAGKMEQYFTDASAQPKLAATEAFINRYDMKWLGPSPFWQNRE